MAWSASKVYAVLLQNAFERTSNSPDFDGDSYKVSLFDNSTTPDNTVTAANSAYAAGVWASGGVSDASGWPAAGRSLAWGSATKSSRSGATYTFDADDTSSANSSTTLSGTYGCLVYDTTATAVTNQGFSYHYFGGTQSVTSGTFTIVWNASGLVSVAA